MKIFVLPLMFVSSVFAFDPAHAERKPQGTEGCWTAETAVDGSFLATIDAPGLNKDELLQALDQVGQTELHPKRIWVSIAETVNLSLEAEPLRGEAREQMIARVNSKLAKLATFKGVTIRCNKRVHGNPAISGGN